MWTYFFPSMHRHIDVEIYKVTKHQTLQNVDLLFWNDSPQVFTFENGL